MQTSHKLLATAVLAASLVACGGSQDKKTESGTVIDKSPVAATEAGTKNLSFDLNLRNVLSAGISASNATITVTKGELVRTQNINISGNSSTVSFNALPIGAYQIAVKVMDGTTIIAQGSGTATINADTKSEIDLVLNAVTGDLQVNVCMPNNDVKYQSGSITALYTAIPEDDGSLRNGVISQPLSEKIHKALVTNTPLTAQFKFSAGAITPKPKVILGEIQTDRVDPIANIDHGLLLTLAQNNQEILSISGCSSTVYALAIENGIDMVFAIDDEFSTILDTGLGTITSETLTVSIEFTKPGYTLPDDITDIRAIDFSIFDSAELFVGVALPSGGTGVSSKAGVGRMKYLSTHIGDTEKASINWTNGN